MEPFEAIEGLISKGDASCTEMEDAVTHLEALEAKLIAEGELDLAKKARDMATTAKIAVKEKAFSEYQEASVGVYSGVEHAADAGCRHSASDSVYVWSHCVSMWSHLCSCGLTVCRRS